MLELNETPVRTANNFRINNIEVDTKIPTIIREFKKKIMENHNGTINCAELLKMNAEKGGKKKEHCDGMIRESIKLIDEYTAE